MQASFGHKIFQQSRINRQNLDENCKEAKSLLTTAAVILLLAETTASTQTRGVHNVKTKIP